MLPTFVASEYVDSEFGFLFELADKFMKTRKYFGLLCHAVNHPISSSIVLEQ